MTDTQLHLAIGIPTITVLLTTWLSIWRSDTRLDDFSRRVNDRFNSAEGRFTSMDARFDRIEGRLDRIEADLRNFYQILGDHGGIISALRTKAAL